MLGDSSSFFRNLISLNKRIGDLPFFCICWLFSFHRAWKRLVFLVFLLIEVKTSDIGRRAIFLRSLFDSIVSGLGFSALDVGFVCVEVIIYENKLRSKIPCHLICWCSRAMLLCFCTYLRVIFLLLAQETSFLEAGWTFFCFWFVYYYFWVWFSGRYLQQL